MKKQITLFLIVALAVASCAKEQNIPEETIPQEPQTTLQHLTFTGISDDGLSKTSLSGLSIVWNKDNDDITVFPGANTSGETFNCSDTENEGLKAIFEGSATVSNTYYAVSPAQTGVASINEDGEITASLPNIQTAVAGSYAPAAGLSVAVTTNHQFQFKNVGALVKFTIDQEGITGIKLETIGGEKLSGDVTIDPADGNITSRDVGDSYNYVQLSSASTFTTGTYYFIILPGNYSDGFRITLNKGKQYTRLTKSGFKAIGRNDSFDLSTIHGNNWKTEFEESEAVKIKNSGSSDGEQPLAYVGEEGYWQTVGTHSAIADYKYNYEIFTKINKDQRFYFEADGGEKFSLNSAGTAVERLTKIANAPFKVDKDGIYRIRMVLPEGEAEIREITAVHVFQNLTSRPTGDNAGYVLMSYYQKGAWYKDNFALKVAANSNNRYKFRFTLKALKSDTPIYEWYGRHSTFGGTPAYENNTSEWTSEEDGKGQAYFKVQPADDDAWEPGFKFSSSPTNYHGTTDDLYYGRLGLDMNNVNGVTHYTHTITGIFENTINNGDEVYIAGNGVDETGNKLKLRYSSTGFNNSKVTHYGDKSGLEGASGYCYEGFCRLKSTDGGRIHFEAGKKHYEFTSDTTSVQRLYPGWGGTQYSVKNNGVYRIRVNFDTETASASIDRITKAQYIQVQRHNPVTNDYDDAPELTYQGGGRWSGAIDFGWVTIQTWGDDEKFKFWFRLYYTDKDKYQFLGRYDTDSDGVNIQTVTEDGTWGEWDWYNKLRVTNKPAWNKADYIYDKNVTEVNHTATVFLKLNADGYTYDFQSITPKQ